MCTPIENSFFLESLSLVNCRVYECSLYLRYSSIKLDSRVVSIGLLNEKFSIFIVCVPQQKMSSLGLFHPSGFFVFCLKIVCSIFCHKNIGKSYGHFRTDCRSVYKDNFFSTELERIFFKNKAEHFFKKLCSYRWVFVTEFFLRLAYYK